MVANGFEGSTNLASDTLNSVAHRPSGAVLEEVEGGLNLSNRTITRLADHLLESNRHLSRFEVELGDATTCQAVEEALRGRGCGVVREPFRNLLDITVPEAISKSA